MEREQVNGDRDGNGNGKGKADALGARGKPTVLRSGVGDDDGRQQERAEYDSGHKEGPPLGADGHSGSRLAAAAWFATCPK